MIALEDNINKGVFYLKVKPSSLQQFEKFEQQSINDDISNFNNFAKKQISATKWDIKSHHEDESVIEKVGWCYVLFAILLLGGTIVSLYLTVMHNDTTMYTVMSIVAFADICYLLLGIGVLYWNIWSF